MKQLFLMLMLSVCVYAFTGCSKSSGTSASSGTVTGVATPGAVSVVTAK